MFAKLRDIRTAKNISAEKMATIIGLQTKAAYYKKESGKIKFTLDEAKIISKYFDMKIEEIFFDNNVSIMETKT